jgi:hypothetical protein
MMSLPNNDEFTPVYIAAKHGEVGIDKYLTDRYAATLSPLTIAAREGYECLISHLINVGSNVRGVSLTYQPLVSNVSTLKSGSSSINSSRVVWQIIWI